MIDCPVYRGENKAWAALSVFREPVPDAQAFVTWVAEREPFLSLRKKAKLPELCVTVTHGPKQQTRCHLASIEEQHIDLIHGSVPSQGLLLHELAHLCSPADSHHDHRYVANYLQLVRTWLGSIAADTLLRELRLARAFP